MRSLISREEPGVLGVASALRQAVPAVYQQDPLFMDLCAAFDDLLAPLVTAVDCFEAYLDPYLAPADFLPWLADLVGYQGPSRQGTASERARIAVAVRDHARRGTPPGVREAAARAAGVPVEQVELADPGGARWSLVPGGVSGDWPQVAARVRVAVPGTASNTARGPEAVRDAVRAAIEAVAGVHCAITVDVTVTAVGVAAAVDMTTADAEPEAAPPRRPRAPGARTYGGES